jgi:hypothetical protein
MTNDKLTKIVPAFKISEVMHAHAIVEDKNVSFDEAKLALVICSGLVHYLIAKADVAGLLKGTTA